MKIEGGDGGNERFEGAEGYGRAFLEAIIGWGDTVSITIGALIGLIISGAFVGIPTALVSFATLAIVVPMALCALGAWMAWRELTRA